MLLIAPIFEMGISPNKFLVISFQKIIRKKNSKLIEQRVFCGSYFSQTLLRFLTFFSFFMNLYCIFWICTKEHQKSLKIWYKDLTFKEIKTKKKFKNKKRLDSFSLMFPKYNDTNISIFFIHIYHCSKFEMF